MNDDHEQRMDRRPTNNLDPLKMVLGLKIGKRKKSKTKCQQKKIKRGLRAALTHALGYAKGYSIRQCSRSKFIITGPALATEPRGVIASLYDYKHDTMSLIEIDSKIGRRFA